MKSYSNILLAVRRCTQLNQGKKTPGVDGLVVLNPKGRGCENKSTGFVFRIPEAKATGVSIFSGKKPSES
jgi:RNA-directed DNA polymerase